MTEFHTGKPFDFATEQWDHMTLGQAFELAEKYATIYHTDTLQKYRSRKFSDLTERMFWEEYLWCVYASGFNAKVLTTLFPKLLTALNQTMNSPLLDTEYLLQVFRNDCKARAVVKCITLRNLLTWDKFVANYLTWTDDMSKLPHIGSTTKYHLARNLGHDCVKPDLHLKRLAEFYQQGTPREMCEGLAKLANERIGVVDFILWSYCAAFGSPKEIPHG